MTDNPAIKICVSKTKIRITLKIRTGLNLELLVPETKKWIRSTTNSITKNENGENVSHYEITKTV